MTGSLTPDPTTATMVMPAPLLVANSKAFQRDALALIAAGATRLAIDCTATGYIDASGLGALITLSKEAAKQGATIVLVGVTDEVRELMTMTEIAPLFTFEAAPPARVCEVCHG